MCDCPVLLRLKRARGACPSSQPCVPAVLRFGARTAAGTIACGPLASRTLRKSSLTIQFVEGQFVDSYDPTIENTFTKLITVNGQEYHLQLVDTAGQDEYSIFPQTYSIDINGYILVYSVTSIKRIPIMLVGNKKDLHMERVISYEEGKALAESWNAAFLESSAKENQAPKFGQCKECMSYDPSGWRVGSQCQ
ncbi:hypothetical protein IHE44_0000105 [Lamprotornis superbus]|uniref:Small monomeric GTPase n=1 Tax=Lamprotornis superbus TaxID=245042 RepID=A0A835P184_9PASS|nr:hypothetical protein IHE44_0000105 [Lamprotornis superbus]